MTEKRSEADALVSGGAMVSPHMTISPMPLAAFAGTNLTGRDMKAGCTICYTHDADVVDGIVAVTEVSEDGFHAHAVTMPRAEAERRLAGVKGEA